MAGAIKTLVWDNRGARRVGRKGAGKKASGSFILSANASKAYALSAVAKAFRKMEGIQVYAVSGYLLHAQISTNNDAGILWSFGTSTQFFSTAAGDIKSGNEGPFVGRILPASTKCRFEAFGI